jgi:hypothetical protein
MTGIATRTSERLICNFLNISPNRAASQKENLRCLGKVDVKCADERPNSDSPLCAPSAARVTLPVCIYQVSFVTIQCCADHHRKDELRAETQAGRQPRSDKEPLCLKNLVSS